MAITVTPSYEDIDQAVSGAYYRRARLVIAGLTSAAANTIPHGLKDIYGNAITPFRVMWVPRVAAGGFETQAADGTNIYWTAGTGQTSMVAYVDY